MARTLQLGAHQLTLGLEELVFPEPERQVSAYTIPRYTRDMLIRASTRLPCAHLSSVASFSWKVERSCSSATAVSLRRRVR